MLLFVALVKTIVTSEIDALKLLIHKHRHKTTPSHWLSPCFDFQPTACICFNLTSRFTLWLTNKTRHSMTKSFIFFFPLSYTPPPSDTSRELRRAPRKVTEGLRSQGQEGPRRDSHLFHTRALSQKHQIPPESFPITSQSCHLQSRTQK